MFSSSDGFIFSFTKLSFCKLVSDIFLHRQVFHSCSCFDPVQSTAWYQETKRQHKQVNKTNYNVECINVRLT